MPPKTKQSAKQPAQKRKKPNGNGASKPAAKKSAAKVNTKKKESVNTTQTVQADVVVDAPAPPVKTPTNPYAKKKNNFTVFTLLNGDIKTFVRPDEAQEFATEHQEVISAEQKFSTKAEMDSYVKSINSVTGSDTGLTAAPTLSPQDKTNLNAIRATLERSRPHPVLKMEWKTTKRSKIVLIFLRAYSEAGALLWWWKRPMALLIANYFAACPTTCIFANDLLTTITLAEMRDPEKGPNDQVVNIRKSDGRKFGQDLLYGWANIHPNLGSAKEEQYWIEQGCKTTADLIRNESKKPVFREAMKDAFSEKMLEALMKESAYGPNFAQWMQNFRVEVEPVDNLNNLVILDKSKQLQMFLCRNEQEHKKYPNDDLRGNYTAAGSPILRLELTTSPNNDAYSTPKPKVTPPSAMTSPESAADSNANNTNNELSQTQTEADDDDDVSTEKEEDEEIVEATVLDDN